MNFTINGTRDIPDLSAMTFARLREVLPPTEGSPLPTFKALREAKPEVLARTETEEGLLTVFCNGFFSYETKSGHTTVYAVDRCARIVLGPATAGALNALDENTLDGCPWAKVLEFAAHERIVSNANRDAERQEVLSLDAIDEDWDARRTVQPEFETRLEEEEARIEESGKLHAALAKLTKRQREVIMLYFFEGLTQEKAAIHLGVSRPYITKTLDRAIEVLRENILRTK